MAMPLLSDVRTLPAGREWVTLLESMDLVVECLPRGTTLFHGVEQSALYDNASRRLADRQWFSFAKDTARAYAEKPGYLLTSSSVKPLSVAVLEQSVVVRHPSTQRLLAQNRAAGTFPKSQSTWDVPEVALKRWYLLSALKLALGRDDLDGWTSPGQEQKEIYLWDVAFSIDVVEVEDLSL